MTAGKPGQPSRLTPARAKRISDSIEAGSTIRIAAETSGLGERTVVRYLARGEAAEQTLRTHIASLTPEEQQQLDGLPSEDFLAYELQNITEGEREYWRLWRAVTRARAVAAERRISSIAEVGLGYESRRTVTVSKQVLGKDGEVHTLEESRTEVTFVRDWRAEAWWLERQQRGDFGQVSAVELTGAGGGPVQTEDVAAKRARVLEAMDQLGPLRAKRERAEIEAGRVFGPPVPEGLAGNGQS